MPRLVKKFLTFHWRGHNTCGIVHVNWTNLDSKLYYIQWQALFITPFCLSLHSNRLCFCPKVYSPQSELKERVLTWQKKIASQFLYGFTRVCRNTDTWRACLVPKQVQFSTQKRNHTEALFRGERNSRPPEFTSLLTHISRTLCFFSR